MTDLLEQLHIHEEIISELSAKKLNEASNADASEVPEFRTPNSELLHDSIVALHLNKNLLLQGPTGSGKTRLAEMLASLFSQRIHTVNCSVDLDAEAMLGFKTLSERDGKSVIDFVPGPVVTAMKQGDLLYIDEINMAKPETLPIINSVLDYRRTLINPFTGETLQASEGFKVIASMNIGYIGTLPLNEALKNRFVTIDVPYLQGDRLLQLLKAQSRLRDEQNLHAFVQLSSDLLEQVRTGQISEDAASIRALLDACDLSAFIPPLRAIQRAIADKLEDEREQSLVMNVAETLFGKQ
ncbi:ATP-binding protein [Marinicrinis lubricantis]|uniref:AAA family ATPase n=1 Tax=Marinicrinis lubricantis TaxID=2086470 RepID=A0ABW1ITD1_9BACL